MNYSSIDSNFTATEAIDIQSIISWANVNIDPTGNVFILNNWYKTCPWAQETNIWQQIKDSDYIQFTTSSQTRNYYYEKIGYIKDDYTDWNPLIYYGTMANQSTHGFYKDYLGYWAQYANNSPNFNFSLTNIFNLTLGALSSSNSNISKRSRNNITAFLLLIYVYFSLTPYFVKTSTTITSMQINKRIITVTDKLNSQGFSNYAIMRHAYNNYISSLTSENIGKLEDERPAIYYTVSSSEQYSCQTIFPILFLNGSQGITWEILKIKRINASSTYNIINDLSATTLYNVIENCTHSFSGTNKNIIHGVFNNSSAKDTLYILTSEPSLASYTTIA